ncbi:hypothetical protein RFI_28703 [Reticulomyxa filosa]|uniref:Uncharacterized protein n=1 Tax=Reticulomyxa filosa TaxID=46433 RepID=X6M427_RETFI|nr:hypothetical protein RFI_28703 [Reticulomyxa filosa]|eukprot:ETO08684.1 hypothetical protein RFI_28703 [Reticulomyxa filosa]
MTEEGKKEIKEFLKDLRPKHVEKIFEKLYDYFECDDMESVIFLATKQWKSTFKETQLPEGQQVKLLKKVNELRKTKDLKPLDVADIISGNTEESELN